MLKDKFQNFTYNEPGHKIKRLEHLHVQRHLFKKVFVPTVSHNDCFRTENSKKKIEKNKAVSDSVYLLYIVQAWEYE